MFSYIRYLFTVFLYFNLRRLLAMTVSTVTFDFNGRSTLNREIPKQKYPVLKCPKHFKEELARFKFIENPYNPSAIYTSKVRCPVPRTNNGVRRRCRVLNSSLGDSRWKFIDVLQCTRL